jgi:hypothetical protein
MVMLWQGDYHPCQSFISLPGGGMVLEDFALAVVRRYPSRIYYVTVIRSSKNQVFYLEVECSGDQVVGRLYPGCPLTHQGLGKAKAGADCLSSILAEHAEDVMVCDGVIEERS